MMATRQVIQIEVTWSGWNKLKLEALIAWLAATSMNSKDLGIHRLVVKEIKK